MRSRNINSNHEGWWTPCKTCSTAMNFTWYWEGEMKVLADCMEEIFRRKIFGFHRLAYSIAYRSSSSLISEHDSVRLASFQTIALKRNKTKNSKFHQVACKWEKWLHYHNTPIQWATGKSTKLWMWGASSRRWTYRVTRGKTRPDYGVKWLGYIFVLHVLWSSTR